jgi:hypothetical protein
VSLLSEQDRGVVRDHLARIQHPVTLLLFTQTIGAPETALIARQVLDELASLNDLIRVEEVNFVLEKDRAAQYGIDHIPAMDQIRGLARRPRHRKGRPNHGHQQRAYPAPDPRDSGPRR